MGTKELTSRPPAHLLEAFEATFQAAPDFAVRAPGRIDLIGAHTDYNDGWVLPAAIDRYVWLAVKDIPTALVTLRTLDVLDGEISDGVVMFRLTDLDARQTLNGQPLPHWATYPAGVAWSLQEAGLATPGSQLVLSSGVPVGAGLSSSAAVEVAYATAWAHIIGWEVEKMELAQLCQRAENDYVGVSTGLMDQFACLFGRQGHALLFDCRTHEWQAVPVPDGVTLVVADTGSRRTLVTSQYDRRRAECEEAVGVLRRYLPTVRALRDVSREEFDLHAHLIPEPARQRAQHIIDENARVLAAARALRAGEPGVLGELMDESHISARNLFAASGPELEAMWQASHGHPARLGGRFVGAGWAGCMVFLAEADGSQDFMEYLSLRYSEATGHTPDIYALKPADGAQVFPLRGR
jgi:galactokinase